MDKLPPPPRGYNGHLDNQHWGSLQKVFVFSPRRVLTGGRSFVQRERGDEPYVCMYVCTYDTKMVVSLL